MLSAGIVQFLDSSLTVPTAIGLPLTLSVNGTAVVDVKASGKMDLRKVSKSPRSVHIDGEIRPRSVKPKHNFWFVCLRLFFCLFLLGLFCFSLRAAFDLVGSEVEMLL